MAPVNPGEGGSPETGFGGKGYRTYVLVSLLVVYTFNFIDRILIGVVAEPLIREFQLYDWQFGLLSGFGFALLYTILGIPIARLAERWNRVAIISTCVIIWSLMTALCGFATSFLMLLLFRVGVGIGEAGCTPPANSLIADYYTPNTRSTALGVYGMGVTLGAVLANLFGGPIADLWSWREAFIYLGFPGVTIGVIIFFTVKEPPRGYTDPPGAPKPVQTSFGEALREILSKPTYWRVTAGSSIAAFVGQGVVTFQTPFLQRNLGISVGEAAVQFNVPIGLASAFGTFFMGYLIQRMTPRYPNAVAWLPALGIAIAVPFYLIGFNATNPNIVLIALCIAGLSKYGYVTSQYTIGMGVVTMRTRATAVAIMLFFTNLFGFGLGPLFVGVVSDLFISAQLVGSEFATGLSLSLCKSDLSALPQIQADYCLAANASGLQNALTFTVLIYFLAAACYFLATRTLQKDIPVSRHAA
jgi:predicted MFS family arabinose efflux permease